MKNKKIITIKKHNYQFNEKKRCKVKNSEKKNLRRYLFKNKKRQKNENKLNLRESSKKGGQKFQKKS